MCGQMEKSFQGDVNSYVCQQGFICLCWGYTYSIHSYGISLAWFVLQLILRYKQELNKTKLNHSNLHSNNRALFNYKYR